MMEDVIVRNNGFNQEELTVRARYPEIFSGLQKILEQKEISTSQLRQEFCDLCSAIRAEMSTRHGDLKIPAAAGSGGRLSAEEERLRNDLRRYAYTLMCDLVGLKLWRYVEPLVQRKSPGKRPKSVHAKKFAAVLHHILKDEETGELTVLDSTAIGDMANQLAYAQRHSVPFQFLIGFLYEVRFEKAAEKERSGDWETWHPKSP